VDDTEFTWVREVTKCAPESAIRDLRQSISTYYKAKKTLAGNKAALKKLRFPSIRSRKKRSGGVGLANDKFYTDGHQVYIPKFGMVNMTESLRFERQDHVGSG